MYLSSEQALLPNVEGVNQSQTELFTLIRYLLGKADQPLQHA